MSTCAASTKRIGSGMAYGVHKVVSFVSSGLWDGCQWLLTVGRRVCGDIPERLERRVRLESLGEVLGAFCIDVVVVETASAGEIQVSAAADSRNMGKWRHT